MKMGDTGYKEKPAFNLAGGAAASVGGPSYEGVARQRDRYCAVMKTRISRGLATGQMVEQGIRELRVRIYSLPEETLTALEDAAAGEEPREDETVKAVAKELGVAVGVLLNHL